MTEQDARAELLAADRAWADAWADAWHALDLGKWSRVLAEDTVLLILGYLHELHA